MTLKEAVYKISSYRAFNPAGRLLYFLCEKIINLTFLHTPEIRSAYLSGSMSGGDITPGLSDIDCVITIKDLDPEDEYRFVTGLERKIRYLLPPFGQDKIGVHLVIYSAGEWELLGDLFLGKKAGRPRELFQKDKMTPRHKLGGDIKGLHHFYKALWKIESLEDSIVKPSESTLEFELRERIMERIVVTIENGLTEISGDGDRPAQYKKLRSYINSLINTPGEPANESRHADVLVRLLHLFDIAAGSSLAPASGKTSGAHAAPDAGTIGDKEIEELSEVISGAPAYDGDSGSVLFARREDLDIFLYDPGNYGISESLIRFYKERGNRRLRIMSKERFQRLYLNFTGEAVGFTDIRNGEIHTLAGSRDYNALLIETYSLFPQLRSPRNFKSRHRYESFRDKSLKTLRTCEAPGFNAPDNGIYSNDKNRERESEQEMFNDLRTLSQFLRDKLQELLSTGH